MSKLKNSICRSFVGILSVLLCGCGMMRHLVALDDVSGFKIDIEISDVERKTGYGLTILRLDGLLKDSALGITKTEIRQKHGRVHIMLYKGLADARSSGRIHATFLIDGKINTVMFGKDRQVVWQQPD